MIGEEPYRWLEAIQNRREYLEDQLATARPVFVCCGKPGILLSCGEASTPKLFEIYDHVAIAGLGHPADIETVRQSAIDAAHLEGFSRSRADVSARRLVNYNLAPALKQAFEQIFAAPLLFAGVMAELGRTPDEDDLWRVDYDGTFGAVAPGNRSTGILVDAKSVVSQKWQDLEGKPEAGSTLKTMATHCAKAHLWAQQMRNNPEQPPTWKDLPKSGPEALKSLAGSLSFALLDRNHANHLAYRIPTLEELGLVKK